MTRKEQIQGAYGFLGGKEHTFYDGMMTCSTFAGTAVSRIVWSIGKEKNLEYLTRAQKPGFPMPVLDALCAAMPPWKELRRRDAKN